MSGGLMYRKIYMYYSICLNSDSAISMCMFTESASVLYTVHIKCVSQHYEKYGFHHPYHLPQQITINYIILLNAAVLL